MAHPLNIRFGSESMLLHVGSTSFPCYILYNGSYVIALRDGSRALGNDGRAADWLIDFIRALSKFTILQKRVIDNLENPIFFKTDNQETYENGIDFALFLEVCRVITDAKNDGYLNIGQLKYAKHAENIQNAIGLHNYKALIEESTGFTLLKYNIKRAISLQLSVHKENFVHLWIAALPDSIFDQIFSFFGFDWAELRHYISTASTVFEDLLINRIPEPLFDELQKSKPTRSYTKNGIQARRNCHAEFEKYTEALIAIMKVSANEKNLFFQLLNRSFPVKRSFAKRKEALNNVERPVILATPLDEALKKTFP